MQKKQIIQTISLLAIICATISSYGAIGQSAIITLVFPYGARSTALGETFTAIADDPSAMYYNPAGLGQSPLANSWKVHYPKDSTIFTAITAKHKKNFGNKETIWLGSSNAGIFRFNGKVWDNYNTYILEEDDDNIERIVEKFIKVDDEKVIGNAVAKIREANNIGTKRSKALLALLSSHVEPSQNVDIKNLSNDILGLHPLDRDSANIAIKLNNILPERLSDTLSLLCLNIFEIEDVDINNLVEIKIPFSIAVRESVTTMAIDNSDRIWIGSLDGIWSYDGLVWRNYTILDGLPSNNILSIAVGSNYQIAVGTDKGLAIFSDDVWQSYGLEEGLPDETINAAVYDKSNNLFIGTNNGLLKKADDEWTIFDTSDGLLSNKVLTLMHSSDNTLWIGHDGGITLHAPFSWKRYKFPGSKVSSFSEYKSGLVWIGTDRGVIHYTKGSTKKSDDGQNVELPPRWKSFHSRNALKGDNVLDITIHGKDVWILTDQALNQLDKGDMQFGLFFERLLPAFGLEELWHANVSGIFPTSEFGTLGFFFNYLNFGESENTTNQGVTIGSFRSYEFVLALSYGFALKEDFSIGTNFKWAYSALAPDKNTGTGVASTIAFDASLLKRNLLLKGLDIGFMLQNMGPDVFYVSRTNSDPIPFTIRLGLAYTVVQNPIHNLRLAIDFDREIVYNDLETGPYPFYKAIYYGLTDESWEQELQEVILHGGIEYWYIYFLAVRLGLLYDNAGKRTEMNFGIGLKYGNFNVDWSYILSPKRSIARDGQWRISVTVAP